MRKRPCAVRKLGVGRVDASELDVVAVQERLELGGRGGHDRGAAGGKRGDCLRIRLGDALDAAYELEMLWPDVRDDRDVGPGDRAQRRHLAESSHPHLRDQDLGLRLEPAYGQRQPDLVVEALLRPQGCRVRCAERAQDVLRRGLPGRVHDGDHARVALRADEGGESGKRRLLVVGDERRRAARLRLVDVLDPGVEGDEEISRPDLSRVGLDGRNGRVRAAGRRVARDRAPRSPGAESGSRAPPRTSLQCLAL